MAKITYKINSPEQLDAVASSSPAATSSANEASSPAEITGEIVWAASEYFGELAGQTYNLGEMEAVKIDQMPNLSPVAKLLLSAVAGAIIQHLLDQNILADQIFSSGTFQITE